MTPNRWDRSVAPFFLAAAAFFAVFVYLAAVAPNGGLRGFDTAAILLIRDFSESLGARWIGKFSRDLSAIGGIDVLGIAVLIVATALVLRARWSDASILLAIAGSGAALASLLKVMFARARPVLVPHAVETFGSSFPSRHAMVATIVYLAFAFLLGRGTESLRLKIYFFGVAVGLALLVGLSRLFLGVHWPTDVLAGWALGLFWILACRGLNHFFKGST